MDEEQWFTKDRGSDLEPLADQEALDAAVSAGRWVEIGSTTDPDGVQGALYARPAE